MAQLPANWGPASSYTYTNQNNVENVVNTLPVKPAATVVATSALPSGTYNNGTAGVGATFTVTASGATTVDGHTLAANDVVLVTGQASAVQNGLYTVTVAGTTGVSTVLTRHTAMNAPADFPAALVPVGGTGTTYGNTLWLCTVTGTPTVGTTNMTFVSVTAIVATGKTVLFDNSLTFAGTDGTTITFPSGTAPAASSVAMWDANSNISANNFIEGFTSTATAAGTTTLTVGSNQIQVFTGSTTQNVKLPTTSVAAGQQYWVINNSTGAVTVQASNGSTILVVGPNASALFTALVATPTTPSNWNYQHLGLVVASGKVLTVNNSVTLTGTDGTTFTLPSSTDTLVGLAAAQALTNKTATLAAGTTGVAPLVLTSGTNLTSPAAGAFEYDGTVGYFTPAASTRGVLDVEQFITLTSSYTLTSQTAAQKLFNATTNGAVTLPAGTYFFDCMFTLSSMSSTSGAFGWTLAAGTAVIGSILWESEANKATLATQASAQNTVNTAANTAICAATTATVGWAHIRGKVRITTGGTVIPQVSLGQAAAAVVGADSYFRVWPAGSSTVTNVGNWS